VADTIGLSDVSSKDTGKGKELKTGNLKRSYNMAKCKPGQVYDQKLKECRVANQPHKKARTVTEFSPEEKKRAMGRSRTHDTARGKITTPGYYMPDEGTERELKPSEFGGRRRERNRRVQEYRKGTTKAQIEKKKKAKKEGIY